MKIITMGGETYKGCTYVEIIEKIKADSWFCDARDIDSYLVWMVHNFWRLGGIGIEIKGDTLEDRCRSVIDNLECVQYIKIVESK